MYLSSHHVKKQLSQVLTCTLYLMPGASLLSSLCKPQLQGERWLFTFLLSYTQILISKHSTVLHPLWCQVWHLVALRREKWHTIVQNQLIALQLIFYFCSISGPQERFDFFWLSLLHDLINILLIAVICGRSKARDSSHNLDIFVSFPTNGLLESRNMG